MEDSKRVMLFSYFPLIMETMVKAGLKHSQPPTEEVLGRIQQALVEAEQLATARACIWLLQDGQPTPMLLLSQAKRIHGDLMIWAENKPEDWFTIQFREENGVYALALFPDIDRSLKRHGVAHLIQEEEILRDPQYQVLFAPLNFTSTAGNNTYAQLKDRIGDTLTLYLYDIDNIDVGNPDILGQLEEDLILEVGPLKVGLAVEGYLERLIDSTGDD